MFALWLMVLAAAATCRAEPVIHYALWFDTEDYIEPAADDAALRIAVELEKLGVRATFKIVGEKARVLESRGRRDVIRALARHDIGYHAENHSIPPSPSMYLQPLGLLEGAQEFERREGQGVRDLRRIFGVTPSCYGQPGSSWGPQSNIALRRMGIPVYMDEGSQVGLDNQPFWFMGVLHVFGLGPFSLRADINDPARLEDARKRFDDRVADLRRRGGGVIHTYYHPTEFVATEFWDAVNFPRGRYTAPSEYRRPKARSPESSEQAYRLLIEFVRHVRDTPGVRFVTAREWPQLAANPNQPLAAGEARKWLRDSIDVRPGYSAADQLLALLGLTPRYVDGPAQRVTSTAASAIPRERFERGKRDAIAYIERHGRLPSHVWFGSERLSLPDFTATLAGDEGGAEAPLRQGTPAFERYIATDARRSFNWAIHPETFAAPELLELGRLQAWTLKAVQWK